MKYLVIDVGGTFTKYAVMDEQCNIYKKDKTPTIQDSEEHFLDMLVRLYRENSTDIGGIALSSAGVIDSDAGYMYTSGSLRCVSNLAVAERLGELCNIPVTVENDAKSAALAEVWKGALSDCRNGIVVIIGTAVGGAVIYDRKVVRGRNCMAGEFSYVLTESSDAFNPTKTLAKTGGVPALIQVVAEKKHLPEESLNGEKIFSMADAGDEEVLSCIREYACRIAVLINNCQFIFDPERVAVGGGVSAQPLLIGMIREELDKISGIYPYKTPVPEVTTCRFFNDSNLIGALYVHLQKQACTLIEY